jgi:methionine sulfoxide reductase heme-binding subunit
MQTKLPACIPGWICVLTTSKAGLKFTWLQVVIHILGWFPLVWVFYEYFAGELSFNPIQDIEQQLGKTALYFLIASLACTPFYTLFGWREPLIHRRALGLYSFLYASLHVLTFIGIDYGFNLLLIGGIVFNKFFSLVGLAAYLLLLPLAITSSRWWMKKMGDKWVSLHRLVYVAGVLVVFHYALAKKGDIFRFNGDILQPILWGGLLLLLLALRFPPVQRWVKRLRQRSDNPNHSVS